MKKIEAIIKPFKLKAVQDALQEIGIDGMTVNEVKGYGPRDRHTEFYRGSEYTVNFLPKLKIDLVVGDQNTERVINAIIESARTGEIRDDKVFISDVEEALSTVPDRLRRRSGVGIDPAKSIGKSAANSAG